MSLALPEAGEGARAGRGNHGVSLFHRLTGIIGEREGRAEMLLRIAAAVLGIVLLVSVGAAYTAPAQEIVFTSNQFTPVEEQEWARNALLAKFTQETNIGGRFITEPEGPYVDRLVAEAKAGRG